MEKLIADLNTNSADIFQKRRPGIEQEKPRQWQTCCSAYNDIYRHIPQSMLFIIHPEYLFLMHSQYWYPLR